MARGEGFVDLDTREIPPEIIALVDGEIAQTFRCIPVEHDTETDHVIVVLENPMDEETLLQLELLLERGVRGAHTNGEAISRALWKYYDIDASVPSPLTPDDLLNERLGDPSDVDTDVDDLKVMKTLNTILRHAVQTHANEVWLEAAGLQGFVRSCAADDPFPNAFGMEKQRARAMLERLKVMAVLHLEERQNPQDGFFAITIDDHQLNVHVNTYPVLDGEIAVLRITDTAR